MPGNKGYIDVKSSQKFIFTEEHKGQSSDNRIPQEIRIEFNISDDQAGILAEEYRTPQAIDGSKATDIFAIITSGKDRKNKIYRSYLIDVKEKISGEHDIEHLIGQWEDSLKHSRCFTIFWSDEGSENIIGVVANEIDYKRIEDCLDLYNDEIKRYNAAPKNIGILKNGVNNIAKKMRLIKMIGDFLNGKVYINGEMMKYNIFCTEYNSETGKNECTISIKL